MGLFTHMATKQRYDAEFPTELMGVPGLLGEMISWMNACANRPAPILSLGASIATLSTAMGRWYKSPTGLRANVYVVGLARSGAGKENGRACAMTMLSRAGLDQLRGTDDLASSAGLLRIMHEYPVRLLCLDELGLLLGNVTSRNAGTHERDILSVLMRLHSTAGTLWAGKAYAERDSKAIEQPHCVLWGTSTPDRFWSALSGSHTIDGFLNRLLVLPHDAPACKAVAPSADPAEPPDGIRAALQAIGSGALSGLPEMGRIVTATTRTISRTVQVTGEAAKELDRLADGQVRRMNSSSCPEAWTRVHEQAIRLALVCAVSLRPDDPVIDLDCAKWGARLAWWSVSVTARAAEERVGDTEEQRAAQRVLAAIRKAPGQCATTRQITRATQRIDRRHRDAALRTLLDAGVIGEVHDIQSGKVAKSFAILAETDEASPGGVTAQMEQ